MSSDSSRHALLRQEDDGGGIGEASGMTKTDSMQAEKEKSKQLRRLEALMEEAPQGENAERGFCSTFTLIATYISFKVSKLVEIWFFMCFFFYVDLFLDISVLKIFKEKHDPYFMIFSIAGIALGTIYTFVEMMQGSERKDPARLYLLLGLLLPVQGHVLALCVYSTIYLSSAHPLLLSFKLAESALEATISSVIQTYSSIFHHLDHNDRLVTYISICSSYLSIAYGFTQFDHRAKGLRHLPGLCKQWDYRLVTVFFFRACEVCSRVVSLGLFQRSVRYGTMMDGEIDFFQAGALIVVLFDFLLMFVLISAYQCSRGHRMNAVLFSSFSVVAYINPLLLKENAFTLPAWLYYTVRFVELAAMGAISYKVDRRPCLQRGELHGVIHCIQRSPTVAGLEAYDVEFYDDAIPAVAFIVSTLLMFLLLPIIRRWMAENVLLQDELMYRSHKFGPTEEFLCHTLLTGNGELANPSAPNRLRVGPRATDSLQFRNMCDMLLDDACQALSASIKAAEAAQRGSRLGRQNSIVVSNFRFQTSRDRKGGGLMAHLEDWLEREHGLHMAKLNIQLSVGERFEQLVHTSWNLRNWLQIDPDFHLFSMGGSSSSERERKHRERHRRCLKTMNQALASDFLGAKDRLQKREVADMLLEVFPTCAKWSQDDPGILEQEMLLYLEKCRLIAHILAKGWEARDRSFLPLAQRLHEAFGTRLPEEMPSLGLQDDPDSTDDAHDWALRVQMDAMIQMYQAIPEHLRFSRDIMSDEASGLFRRKKEVQACIDTTEMIMQHRNLPIIGKLVDDGTLPVSEKIDLILDAFSDNASDMVFAPSSETWWDTAKVLNMRPQSSDVLRLTKVEKVPPADAAETEVVVVPVQTRAGLSGALTIDGLEKYQLGGWTIKFHFMRVPEVDDQPLSEIKNWKVTETILLRFLRMATEPAYLCGGTTLEFLSRNQESDTPAEKAANVMSNEVEKVQGYQRTLEEEVKGALKRKCDLLAEEGTKKANPKETTRTEMVTFREQLKEDAKKAATAEDMTRDKFRLSIKALRTRSSQFLSEHERLHDLMKEYLKKVVDAFVWSTAVVEHVHVLQSRLQKDLEALRKVERDYWAGIEDSRAVKARRNAREAQSNANSAKVKEEKAQEEKQKALETAEKLRAERDALTQEKEGLSKELDEVNSSLSDAKGEIESKDAKLHQLEKDLRAAHNATEQSKKQVKTWKSKYEELRKQLLAAEKDAKERDVDVSWLAHIFDPSLLPVSGEAASAAPADKGSTEAS